VQHFFSCGRYDTVVHTAAAVPVRVAKSIFITLGTPSDWRVSGAGNVPMIYEAPA
jgi:hypothetical protein